MPATMIIFGGENLNLIENLFDFMLIIEHAQYSNYCPSGALSSVQTLPLPLAGLVLLMVYINLDHKEP